MAYGLWDQVNWLTKTVKRLCCALDLIRKEDAANPCYLEITTIPGGGFPYSSLADYNTNTIWDTPFTSLVTIGDSIQRLYGGTNVNLLGIFTANPNITSFNDGCGVITVIGSEAFRNCSSLTYFNASSVTVVGDSAFEECTVLQSINFPLLTTAGNASFRNCNSVTSVNLPLLETIDQGCFSTLNNFTGVLSLPKLLVAPQYSFTQMNFCSGYDFPKVQSVGYGAFFDSCKDAAGNVSFNLKSCTDLGGTVGDDDVWENLINKTIALTVPSILMTCNAGNPDGDIQVLIDPIQGNTVTITTV